MTTPAVPLAPVHSTEKPTRYVAVLFLVSTVSFMDRQILAILLEPIKNDLRASDTEMGLLTGFAFVLFFALASVPIARAADRYSRRNIIALALTFWSVMAMLSGYVASFLQLAAARVGLGIGEAAAAPAAHSMISDLFPKDRRSAPLEERVLVAFRDTLMRRDLFEEFCREYVRELNRFTLKGDLAGMLSAARDSKRSPETGDLLVQIKLVAGARNPLNLEFSWSAA